MTSTRQRTTELVFIAIFAVLIAACSWISIPTTVPFTMQTFAVFLTLLLLGGKRGTMAVLVYLLLGAVGAPVFANFSGGFGILIGSTGGYLIGFLSMTILYWLIVDKFTESRILKIIALVLGLAVCYTFGTIWFVTIYTNTTEPIGIMTALWWCVFPYIIPDLIKLGLAFTLAERLRRYVPL